MRGWAIGAVAAAAIVAPGAADAEGNAHAKPPKQKFRIGRR